MLLLHEANSRNNNDLTCELQKRLLGHGDHEGNYHNGVANPYIEGWARRFGFRDPDQMADFRQECHTRMIRHIIAREGESLAWESAFDLALSGVAIDVWRYFQARGHSRSPAAHPQATPLDYEPDQRDDPLTVTERAEARAAVLRVLSMLPHKQAEAIRRYDLQGETYEEIGISLGIQADTIRARRNAGLRRLGLELSAFKETDEPKETV